MTIKRHFGAVAGVALLAVGLAVGTGIALPGAANAASCAEGTPCDVPADVTLTGGTLTMTAPTAEAWAADVTGAPQTIYDTTAADDTFQVSDLRGLLTGTGAGWTLTATATTFTDSAADTIPDSTPGKVLSFGGGSNSTDAATAPASACVTSGDCVAPTNGLAAYPYFVLTGSTTPTTIYEAAAGTGTGNVQIGSGANLAVWALTLPASVAASSYTSTITLSVNTGP